MDEQKIYTRPYKRLYCAVFGAAFAAGAAGCALFLYYLPQMAWHDDSVGPAYGVAALLGLLGSGFLGGYYLWTALDWRPKLVLRDDGIIVPSHSASLIRWEDIRAVAHRIRSSRNYTSVELSFEVLDAEHGAINGVFTVQIEELTLDDSDILKFVYAHIPKEKHLGGNGNGDATQCSPE